MSGSSRIRTQIGLAKKRLKEALERSKDLSTLESLRTDPVEEIYQELIEICDVSDILRAEQLLHTILHGSFARFVTLRGEKVIKVVFVVVVGPSFRQPFLQQQQWD
uniref:Aldedh domain-containing protein n=1 Tax=Caenorhabditis tropicalis TaxID=1561998 RepID=A0A1I7TTX0_9PELO